MSSSATTVTVGTAAIMAEGVTAAQPVDAASYSAARGWSRLRGVQLRAVAGPAHTALELQHASNRCFRRGRSPRSAPQRRRTCSMYCVVLRFRPSPLHLPTPQEALAKRLSQACRVSRVGRRSIKPMQRMAPISSSCATGCCAACRSPTTTLAGGHHSRKSRAHRNELDTLAIFEAMWVSANNGGKPVSVEYKV